MQFCYYLSAIISLKMRVVKCSVLRVGLVGFPNFKLLGKNLLRASGEKQEKFVTVDEIMITVIS